MASKPRAEANVAPHCLSPAVFRPPGRCSKLAFTGLHSACLAHPSALSSLLLTKDVGPPPVLAHLEGLLSPPLLLQIPQSPAEVPSLPSLTSHTRCRCHATYLDSVNGTRTRTSSSPPSGPSIMPQTLDIKYICLTDG